VIRNHTDQKQLQEYLNKLVSWVDEWQMMFNVDKCKLMHFGKRASKNRAYLAQWSRKKDLGIIIKTI